MAAATQFQLRVVTPAEVIVDCEVSAVQFVGVDGEYGVLAGHAPLMTATDPGVLSYVKADGSSENMLVTDGFAEMRDNVLSIVCEAGEDLHKIDVERARASEARARERLANKESLSGEDSLRAESALRRALARQLGSTRAGRADI